MSDAIIVGILGFAGTLFGSLLGVLAAQKLLTHRIAVLEKKSDSHDTDIRSISDKTIKLEGRMHEAEHDIRDLKRYHIPN